MLLGAIQVERKGALDVNYVRQYVQLRQSQLKLNQETMEQEEPQDTTLIWLNVFIVVYAKSPVLLMQLFKGQILNFLLKLEKSFITQKKNSSTTEISGKVRLLKI